MSGQQSISIAKSVHLSTQLQAHLHDNTSVNMPTLSNAVRPLHISEWMHTHMSRHVLKLVHTHMPRDMSMLKNTHVQRHVHTQNRCLKFRPYCVS